MTRKHVVGIRSSHCNVMQSLEEIIELEGSAVTWSLAQQQASWLIKETEANQHSSAMDEAFRHCRHCHAPTGTCCGFQKSVSFRASKLVYQKV